MNTAPLSVDILSHTNPFVNSFLTVYAHKSEKFTAIKNHFVVRFSYDVRVCFYIS